MTTTFGGLPSRLIRADVGPSGPAGTPGTVIQHATVAVAGGAGQAVWTFSTPYGAAPVVVGLAVGFPCQLVSVTATAATFLATGAPNGTLVHAMAVAP